MDPTRFDTLPAALGERRSRRQVLKIVAGGALGGLVAVAAVRPAAAAYQLDWRHCGACHGLFFAGGGAGYCPAFDRHTAETGNYSLDYRVPPGSYKQAGWRYCHRCKGLFYRPNGFGRCPAGNGHDGSTSVNYVLRYHDAFNPPDPFFEQVGWRYCRKCGGLFYRPDGVGLCPAGGGHDGRTSANYGLYFAQNGS